MPHRIHTAPAPAGSPGMVTRLVLTLWLLALPLTVAARVAPAPSDPDPSDVVTLATHNLCPYGCYDAEGRFDGTAVRVVRDAFRELGVTLAIVVVPWERAEAMSFSGEADGFFAASRSAGRDENGVLSVPVAEQRWTWFLLRSNPNDPAAPDFRLKARVASFHGANMSRWLRANNYKVVAAPPTTEHLWRMLLSERFDAMLANDQVMAEIIRNEGLEEKLKSYPLRNEPLGVYFSKRFLQDRPGFMERFNTAVRQYRQQHR